jgi:hypothetical protein
MPNGAVYQVQGLAEDEAAQLPGTGYLGELRRGSDGTVYQWVQGIDGLGNPVGFWRALRRIRRGIRRVVRRALPLVQQFAPLVPGLAPALTAATPVLRRAGVAGHSGLGGLYQAPEGTVYQVQGLAEEEQSLSQDDSTGFAQDELTGFGEDELTGFGEDELMGLAEDELTGFGEDELTGLSEDELTGLAEDELTGIGEDEGLGQDELQSINGYVRQGPISGLDAYVPPEQPQTRWFVQPSPAPEIWKPLW